MNESFSAKTLILVFDSGETTASGNPKYLRKSVKNIREEADNAELYEFAVQLAEFYPLELVEVYVDTDILLHA